MTTEIVPFGKYKGQPAEVLLADTDYCAWLAGQPWFRERFPTVYQVIVNYGAEPADSPEHNGMQASFLDVDRCLALASRVLVGDWIAKVERLVTCEFEVDGWDIWLEVMVRSFPDPDDIRHDVRPDGWIWASHVRVEIKPDLGDDYPAVLRQVQRYPIGHDSPSDAGRVVLVRRHRFEQVTWEQVRSIFAASRILLLAEAELDAAR